MLEKQILFNGQTTTGFSTPIYVRDFRHIVLVVATKNVSSAQTVRVRIAHAYEEEVPDFSTTNDSGNQWSYAQSLNLKNGYPIDGNVGIEITGDDDVVAVELNQNMSAWLSVEIETIDAGSVTVTAYLSDNT